MSRRPQRRRLGGRERRQAARHRHRGREAGSARRQTSTCRWRSARSTASCGRASKFVLRGCGRCAAELAISDGGAGPSFGADEIDVQTALVGLRPPGVPALRVNAGHASPLPSLALTGITGVIAPPPVGRRRAAGAGWSIDLRGSYGGAQRDAVDGEGARRSRGGGAGRWRCAPSSSRSDASRTSCRASVLKPDNTTLDAALDLALDGRRDSLRRRAGGRRAVAGARGAGRRAGARTCRSGCR